MLNDLTIVIPTYNRHGYALRQAHFWTNYNVHVEIFDGSPNSISKSEIKSLPQNVRYWHSPVSIEERFKMASKMIRTKYSILISDDEFVLPNGLTKCVAFLEDNDDYVSCKGTALIFKWASSSVVAKTCYPLLRGYKIISNDPQERAERHLSDYQMATLWSVTRTEVLFRALTAVGECGTCGSAAVPEILISIVTSLAGKVNVLDELMWLRSAENKNVWWESGNLSFDRWLDDGAFSEEHQRFCYAVLKNLPESVFSEFRCTDILHIAHKYGRVSRKQSKLLMIEDQLLSSKWTRNILRSLVLQRIRTYFSHKSYKPIDELADSYQSEGQGFVASEMKTVVDSIVKFYN